MRSRWDPLAPRRRDPCVSLRLAQHVLASSQRRPARQSRPVEYQCVWNITQC